MWNCPSWTELAEGEWRREYTKEYRTATVESAGMVTKDGKPIHFSVTTARDRATNENTPSVYYYISGTMTAAWDTGHFIRIHERLQGQESAPEAAAEA